MNNAPLTHRQLSRDAGVPECRRRLDDVLELAGGQESAVDRPGLLAVLAPDASASR